MIIIIIIEAVLECSWMSDLFASIICRICSMSRPDFLLLPSFYECVYESEHGSVNEHLYSAFCIHTVYIYLYTTYHDLHDLSTMCKQFCTSTDKRSHTYTIHRHKWSLTNEIRAEYKYYSETDMCIRLFIEILWCDTVMYAMELAHAHTYCLKNISMLCMAHLWIWETLYIIYIDISNNTDVAHTMS